MSPSPFSFNYLVRRLVSVATTEQGEAKAPRRLTLTAFQSANGNPPSSRGRLALTESTRNARVSVETSESRATRSRSPHPTEKACVPHAASSITASIASLCGGADREPRF